MRNLLFTFIAFFISVGANAVNPQKGNYFLYCHMSDHGQWTAFAISKDGLHYQDIIDGDSIFSSHDMARVEGGTRDAYICRAYNAENEGSKKSKKIHSPKYLMVTTDMNNSMTKELGKKEEWDNYGIDLLTSDDLIHWKSTTFDFRKGMSIFYTGSPAEPSLTPQASALNHTSVYKDWSTINRVWAPQIFWDETYVWPDGKKGGYFIYYSLWNRAEEKYDRMYYSYADETFTKLTAPQLLFDWGYATIDADINYVPADGMYHMMIKKEGGTPGLFTTMSKSLTGPWPEPISDDYVNFEGKKKCEGVSAFQIPGEDGWRIAYIEYSSKPRNYRICKADKYMRHFSDPKNIQGVNGPQHGSFMRITEEEYNHLKAWSDSVMAQRHWGKDIDARHDKILSGIKGAGQMCPGAKAQKVVSITSFGAKPVGKSQPDCKPAFDKAMQKAQNTNGGLHITVPKGDWFVKGPIHLVCNVTLELQEGARLLFSDDAKDYLPMVKTSWEGNFCQNYSPFIYGYQLHDVAIIGKGTIDGNCVNTFPTWRKDQKKDQQQLRDQCHKNVPYSERNYGFDKLTNQGHLLRPHFVQFYGCKNVTLQGIFITNSPFWCVHLLQCDNVICRGLRYDAKLVNNDGIDPEMTKNLLIEDIDFNNGDDNVAIKAGRDNDGWKEQMPSENIIIRNCRFKGLHGLVIGSEMSAGVRNVFVENCTYGGYNKRALYIKTNPNRGGYVKHIYFRNCEFGEMEDMFYITSMYAGEGSGDTHFTDIHDIHVKDVHAKKVSNAAIVLQGTEARPLKDISFSRINVDECKIGFSSVNAPGVTLTDCNLGGTMNSAPSQVTNHDHLFDRK